MLGKCVESKIVSVECGTNESMSNKEMTPSFYLHIGACLCFECKLAECVPRNFVKTRIDFELLHLN